MKKSLIIGIILIILSLGLIIYHEFIDVPININEITNKGLKEENKKVYLNATFVAGKIVGEIDTGFYVMFGDGVQYIVNISHDKANKINKYLLDNPEESYRIEGITKLIQPGLEEDGINFTNNWLNTTHTHEIEEEHDHDITRDEFYHYYGYVYLDNTINFDIIKLFIYITSIIGIVLILNFINTKYHFI